MKLACLICSLIAYVSASGPHHGYELLLQASEILAESRALKRVRVDNSTSSFPPVLRLSLSPINTSSQRRYREPEGTLRHLRFHRNESLQIGESMDAFSDTTNFFETRIPQEIRVAILETFANMGGRPIAQLEISRFTPLLRQVNFTDSIIVVKYMEYLCSFLYMNVEVHQEILHVNRLRLQRTAATIASQFRTTGFPQYITTERIFEWYKCLFASNLSITNALYIRQDEFGLPLVNIPPSAWSACFIRPRLERLRTSHTEKYSE